MKLSLATRIFLGYAVVLVTFGAVSLFSVAELYRSRELIQLVSQGYLQLSQDATAIENLHTNQQRDTDRLISEESPRTRRELIALTRLYFPPLMAQRLSAAHEEALSWVPLAPRSEAVFLTSLATRFLALNDRAKATAAATDQVFTLLAHEAPEGETLKIASGALRHLQSAMTRDILRVQRELEQRIRDRVDEAEQRTRRTGLAIVALSLFAIGVGLAATAFSARALKPIGTLIQGISRIGRGDYSAQLGVKGDDEVAVLAREFDAMATSLQTREAQLNAQQEALLRAEQLAAAGRISAQIAHEVRNPLSSIGLNVELLEEALGRATFTAATEAREAKDLLQAVTKEVDRLTEVTEHYLRMAKPPPPTLGAESMEELLDAVLDFSREELERAHVEVVRAYRDAQLPLVMIDEGQLRQVFLNLLRNSREAMEGGGRLRLSATVLEQSVEVWVQDSGRGMSPEVMEHIFEPFFSTKERGTGLGLAVCQQLLQAQGGALRCQSAPGEGATFIVQVPRC